jgi:hypothetical protein
VTVTRYPLKDHLAAHVHDLAPGPLADSKTCCCRADGLRQPVADEVESAHLLANESRERLHRAGLNDREILAYADDFVAEDRGDDVDAFIGWAILMHGRRRRVRV